MSYHSPTTRRVPLATYVRLVQDYSQTLMAQSDADLPETTRLRNEIDDIMARANADGLKFDDDSVSSDPRAKALREEMDKVYPPFQELARKATQRIARLRHFQERITQAQAAGIDSIVMPDNEAIVLLGLEQDLAPARSA